MGVGDFEVDESEFYYKGSLPVLAGRLRRRIIGYYDGNVPPGMRTGREIRLVKLPELNWVYAYLMRATGIGAVLYVRDAATMEGVEGFHPIRSASEIRQAKPALNEPRYRAPSGVQSMADPELDFDELTKLKIPVSLTKGRQTK